MMVGLIVALQFLTRLPVNIMVDFSPENIGKATFFFPYVGNLLGLIAFIPFYFLGHINREIASFLSVSIMIILTGGLHLDGLSDMVDGFFSSRNREKMLEIMEDSRIGAFGVISLILLIQFKYIVLSSFTSKQALAALVFSMGNARLVSLIQIAYKKMIKPGGMGDMIHSSNNEKYIITSIILYIVIIFTINPIYLLPLMGALIMGELISKLTYKKIGGFTGDLYGAVIELSESISLLCFLGVMQWI